MIKAEVMETKGVRTLFLESSAPGKKEETDTLDQILELIMAGGNKRGEYLASGVLAVSAEIAPKEES